MVLSVYNRFQQMSLVYHRTALCGDSHHHIAHVLFPFHASLFVSFTKFFQFCIVRKPFVMDYAPSFHCYASFTYTLTKKITQQKKANKETLQLRTS